MRCLLLFILLAFSSNTEAGWRDLKDASMKPLTPLPEVSSKIKGGMIVVTLLNNSNNTPVFSGYTPQTPNPRFEYLRMGRGGKRLWDDSVWNWCGTDLAEHSIKPHEKRTFLLHTSGCRRRAYLTLTSSDEKQQSDVFLFEEKD